MQSILVPRLYKEKKKTIFVFVCVRFYVLVSGEFLLAGNNSLKECLPFVINCLSFDRRNPEVRLHPRNRRVRWIPTTMEMKIPFSYLPLTFNFPFSSIAFSFMCLTVVSVTFFIAVRFWDSLWRNLRNFLFRKRSTSSLSPPSLLRGLHLLAFYISFKIFKGPSKSAFWFFKFPKF